MKNIMTETAQGTCGMSKGPHSHKEHGGGMRKLLQQKRNRKKVWKLEKRKINRGMEGVQEK